MEITIEKLNPGTLHDVNQPDGEFKVDSKLVLYLENDEIRYDIIPATHSRKRYDPDYLDYTTYLNHPDKTVFLAYVDGQVIGQIILRKNWNGYTYIEDIAVDVHFRRQGIGVALMKRAVTWAQDRNHPGIMLETQNNNVAACKFYEKCGFVLGGFDRYLYRGIYKDTEEIALFWYLVF
jgi:ribosomal protein S18 acetylase RimI-like enzyme